MGNIVVLAVHWLVQQITWPYKLWQIFNKIKVGGWNFSHKVYHIAVYYQKVSTIFSRLLPRIYDDCSLVNAKPIFSSIYNQQKPCKYLFYPKKVITATGDHRRLSRNLTWNLVYSREMLTSPYDVICEIPTWLNTNPYISLNILISATDF